MFHRTEVNNKSRRTADDMKEIEAKFERIQKFVQAEGFDEMVIYTKAGVISSGNSKKLMAVYIKCDREFCETVIPQIGGMAAMEMIAGMLDAAEEVQANGAELPDCGNPDCNGHVRQRGER